jgi:hypothetical protein
MQQDDDNVRFVLDQHTKLDFDRETRRLSRTHYPD